MALQPLGQQIIDSKREERAAQWAAARAAGKQQGAQPRRQPSLGYKRSAPKSAAPLDTSLW